MYILSYILAASLIPYFQFLYGLMTSIIAQFFFMLLFRTSTLQLFQVLFYFLTNTELNDYSLYSIPLNLQRSRSVWLGCEPGLTLDMLMRRRLVWPPMNLCRFDQCGCSVNQRCRGYSGARRLTQVNAFEGKQGRTNDLFNEWFWSTFEIGRRLGWTHRKPTGEHWDKGMSSPSNEKQIFEIENKSELYCLTERETAGLMLDRLMLYSQWLQTTHSHLAKTSK